MQEFAKFSGLHYYPGSAPHLLQGVKHGRTPAGAIKGGNGSFRMPGEPSKLYLAIKTDSGRCLSINIINIVRAVLDRSRITQKLCDDLENVFASAKFEVDGDYITNLSDIISKV